MHKCVILPSAVICASRVGSYKANIISLRPTGAISLLRSKNITLSGAKHITKSLFSVIFAVGEFYAQVRDIAFGSDMRFARWKLQGEYNITATNGSNITFAKQKYHAERSEAYH